MTQRDRRPWEHPEHWERLKAKYLRLLDGARNDFERIAQSNEEAEIHRFLISHNFLLDDIFSTNYIVWSKYKLAESFVTDFVLVGSSKWSQAIRPTITFIEIERPDLKLFTKKGAPTSHLTHAIFQVQQWKNWLLTNREYFATRMMQQLQLHVPSHPHSSHFGEVLRQLAHGFREHFLIIIGRRDSLLTKDRLLLERMNDDLDSIRIITYDTLFYDKEKHNRRLLASSIWETDDICATENAVIIE